MCGRMSLFVPASALEERFDAAFGEPWTPRYNLAPGDDLAVVANDDPETIARFEWGLLPSWVDESDDWPAPINARAETLDEKRSFREAFRERRCLVLADGFYEWKDEGKHKQPYRVTRSDGEPFAFAGLWESRGSNGDSRETVTVVTTEANEVVSGIHDRMPVVLAPDEEEAWLREDDPEASKSVLDPFEETEAFPVSTAVNDPANDSPAVVEPVDVGEQSGLGDF